MSRKKLNNLLRANIKKLEVYNPFSSIKQTDNSGKLILLNANENPYLPYKSKRYVKDVNRYGEMQPQSLIKSLATFYKVKPQNILLNRGADDGIDILTRSFCEPKKDGIIICPPTFSMYEAWAKIQDAKVFKVPLMVENGYQLNTKKILEIAKRNSIKLIFIPNPSAPMGHLLNKNDILNICKELKDKTIVVIDEAYLEFADSTSFTKHIKKYPNIIVLRTLSKAFGMAGLRIGITIADEEFVPTFRAVVAPYALTIPGVEIAQMAFCPKGIAQMKKSVKRLVSERQRLEQRLKSFSFIEKIYPSATNFIFLQAKDAKKLVDYCAENKIMIRLQASQMKNAIRISAGTKKENNKLIDVFKSFGEIGF